MTKEELQHLMKTYKQFRAVDADFMPAIGFKCEKTNRCVAVVSKEVFEALK